jgi:hypothetical protein
MRTVTLLKSIITAGFTIFMLSGCSSGSTASGLGLGVGGTWFGQLLVNNAVIANFTMSLSQSSNAEDAFAPSDLTGVFNSNNECIGSGSLNGQLNADSITLTILATGTLDMAGTAGNSSMSGTFSNQGSIAGERGNAGTSCNIGGSWRAER